jgi:hypothetical protein
MKLTLSSDICASLRLNSASSSSSRVEGKSMAFRTVVPDGVCFENYAQGGM